MKKKIFVFGSNLAGRHGKGAALCARNSHEAEYGVGVGRTGNAYAIPTKDAQIRTLPLARIEKYVEEFLVYAREHPELEFEVTKIGCGLAGYREHEIKPMFKDAPMNCHLPDWWRPSNTGVVKAISLIQPWASALFVRLPNGNHLKGIETRSWKTNFTGRVAVHASKGFPKWAREFAESEQTLGRLPSRLPFGAIIGFVTIMGMRRTEDIAPQITAIERMYGDYSPGRWGWMLCDAEPLPDDKIIPCKGSLGLWEVPAELGLRL